MDSKRLTAHQKVRASVNGLSLVSLAASFALLLGLANLAACGKLETDPKSDYQELKDWVPPHNEAPRTQIYPDSAILQIEAEKNLVFIQGKASSFLFTPRLLLGGVSYELVAKNLPEGARFERSSKPEEAGKYRLTYQPAIGLLADQEPSRPFQFQVELTPVGEVDAAASEVLAGLHREREFSAIILRSDEQPVVEKVELPIQEIQAGESLAFKVIVKDVAAGDRAPRLFVDNETGASRESAKIDAKELVKVDQKPEKLEGGRYRFSARFDSKGVSLPGTATLVPARFVLVIASRSGLPAVDQLVEIRVKRNLETSGAPSVSSQGEKK